MSKHITEFDLQDAKALVGKERLEWLCKVEDVINELESYDVTAISHTNEIWGEDFVEKELKRLYDIKDELELDKNMFFGINVTLKFSQGVDAETYEEAVEIVKDNFLKVEGKIAKVIAKKQEYGIQLKDEEIDPEEFDLRSILDLLNTNGYEDASNFLQLHLSKKE